MPNKQNNKNGKCVSIFQINLGKSRDAQNDLINRNLSDRYDIILAQELYIHPQGHIPSPSNFRPVIPETRRDPRKGAVRSVIWVSTNLNTANWEPLGQIESNDITAIRIKSGDHQISIFNVYNDCNNDKSLVALDSYLRKHALQLTGTDDDHIIWAGDFNRHHPLWDDKTQTRLFTPRAINDANRLIEYIADWDMELALPKEEGPTLQHKATKSFSRPDLVLCTNNSRPLFVTCEVKECEQPIHTDHFPIVFTLELPTKTEMVRDETSINFRAANWEAFNDKLETLLSGWDRSNPILDKGELEDEVQKLTETIQEAIRSSIKSNNPRPNAKRWWNSDLETKRKQLKRLRSEVKKNRAIPDHSSHKNLKTAIVAFSEAMNKAKREHWTEYLENAMEKDIWTANKYISEPAADGGKPRIPTLRVKNDNGIVKEISANEGKAEALAKSFFPRKPTGNGHRIPANFIYPPPKDDPEQLTAERIH